MSDTHRKIHTTLTLALLACGDESTIVPVELEYRTDDPLAVTLVFASDVGQVTKWMCGRSLLRDGIGRPVGDGDVRIRPFGGDSVLIELVASESYACLLASANVLATFLAETVDLVDESEEVSRLDIDAVIARILSCSGSSD